MSKKLKKLTIPIVLLLLILTGVFVSGRGEIESVSYVDFMEMVNEGKVSKLTLTPLGKLDFITEGKTFTTDNPRNPEFKEILLNKKVEVVEKQTKSLWVMFQNGLLMIFPWIMLLFLYKMVQGQTKTLMPKKANPVNTNITFADVAGNREVTKDMEFLIDFLKDPTRYTKIGAEFPKGVLFYGPPGTGKTLTAKALAGEADVPFITATGSDFVEMYVGLGARKVRTLFEQARKMAPCILFIDEIDSLAGIRGGSSSNREHDQTLNALLSEMDGFGTKEGVLVIAATNRLDSLDPAVLRAGRFDRHIAIELPDLNSRKEILQLHSSGKKLSDEINLDDLAKMTIGFSGASISSLLNEAAIIAVNRKSTIVEMQDVDTAYIKVITKGSLKENYQRNSETTELIAYHEAGHALLNKLITNNNVPKVSITPTTSGAGGFTVNIPEEKELQTKTDLLNHIIVLYGGRAAEELFTGSPDKVTTGASNDISVSTKLIKRYFEVYGMSEKYGMLDLTQYEETNIIEESKQLSNNLYKETLELLRKNRDTLDIIACELIEKETIDENDLDRIMGIVMEKIA